MSENGRSLKGNPKRILARNNRKKRQCVNCKGVYNHGARFNGSKFCPKCGKYENYILVDPKDLK